MGTAKSVLRSVGIRYTAIIGDCEKASSEQQCVGFCAYHGNNVWGSVLAMADNRIG